MAIDLSRFADAFHEEACEHLVTMESLLLAVNIRRPDAEALDAIFRAAHSIKGGAGAFGHAALGEFTHALALDAAGFPDRATVDALLLELSAVGTLVDVSVAFAPGEGGSVSFIVETAGAVEVTRDSLRLFVSDGSIRQCRGGKAGAGAD